MGEEIWKRIPGCSYHEASTLGRIKRISRTTSYKSTRWQKKTHSLFISEKILNLCKTNQGYINAGIYKDALKKFISMRVHVLIARTFLGPRPAGFEVAHLNGNGYDNRLENLKYCMPKENHSHKRAHGTLLRGESIMTSKLKSQDVLKIKELHKQKVTYKRIAKKYGLSTKYIWLIISGKRWKHLA